MIKLLYELYLLSQKISPFVKIFQIAMVCITTIISIFIASKIFIHTNIDLKQKLRLIFPVVTLMLLCQFFLGNHLYKEHKFNKNLSVFLKSYKGQSYEKEIMSYDMQGKKRVVQNIYNSEYYPKYYDFYLGITNHFKNTKRSVDTDDIRTTAMLLADTNFGKQGLALKPYVVKKQSKLSLLNVCATRYNALKLCEKHLVFK